MTKYLAVLALFFLTTLNTYSQKTPSDYSFVVVPDRYDFLFEKDQYQLNSLTKFLFNKHGFNAYFNTELPNISRCDGLWADVIRDDGFVWTRLTVVLNDCDGNEVYRSAAGRSKLKEYKKAYYEAMRGAFESIQGEEFQQPEPKVFADFENQDETVSVETKNSGNAMETAKVEEKTVDSSITKFVSGKYTLEMVDGEYQILFGNNKIGKLTATSQPDIFIARSSEFFGVAYKTAEGFTIEKDTVTDGSHRMMKFVPLK